MLVQHAILLLHVWVIYALTKCEMALVRYKKKI